MKLRNIEVTYRVLSGKFQVQTFADWYEFADWLKEREVTNLEHVVIKCWHYTIRRVY